MFLEKKVQVYQDYAILHRLAHLNIKIRLLVDDTPQFHYDLVTAGQYEQINIIEITDVNQ